MPSVRLQIFGGRMPIYVKRFCNRIDRLALCRCAKSRSMRGAKSIHDLLMEGVELALKKRGYPALAEMKAKWQRTAIEGLPVCNEQISSAASTERIRRDRDDRD